MRLTVRSSLLAWAAPAHGSMRREYIYPHRSIRSVRITLWRITRAVVTAAALSGMVAAWSAALFTSHNDLCLALLQMAGVPVKQVTTVPVFPAFAQAPVVIIPVVRLEASPWRFAASLIAGLAVLGLIRRFVPLARGFVVFLTVLLLATAGAVILDPSSQLGSAEFSQIWLRGELLVWLLLPVFSAGMFTLIQPTWVVGVIWALLVQGFGFFWSIARLAFCLGVMHYSGALFIPALWFSLGLLADIVYLMVFYSIVVHWSASRYWGKRAQ